MPLSATCLRLSSGRCLHILCSNTLVSQPRRILQTRVFVSFSGSPNRKTPSLRSPLQWSQIVHGRRPGTAVAPTAMGADSPVGGAHKRGHSHGGHHHHHDNTYLTSKNKKDAGVRITRIGLYVNLGMAVAKGFGGYVFNSAA